MLRHFRTFSSLQAGRGPTVIFRVGYKTPLSSPDLPAISRPHYSNSFRKYHGSSLIYSSTCWRHHALTSHRDGIYVALQRRRQDYGSERTANPTVFISILLMY